MNISAITLLTALSALIAGIIGPLVSMSVARRQIRASVVSKNRERWLETLRDAVAEFIALVTRAALIRERVGVDIEAAATADEEYRTTAERLILVRSKILLMTNPLEEPHLELCRSIESLHDALLSKRAVSVAQWLAQLDALVLSGRALLRVEWERVKRGE